MRLGIYEHYSGKRYQLIGVARHSETLEEMIVYQALYDDYGLWTRPRSMFEETVVVDGKSVPRFSFIRDIHTQAPTLSQNQR